MDGAVTALPAIPIEGPMVYFPVLTLPIRVGKPASVAAWRRAQASDGQIVLLHGDSHIAALFRIFNSADAPGDQVMGQLQGIRRVRVVGRESGDEGLNV